MKLTKSRKLWASRVYATKKQAEYDLKWFHANASEKVYIKGRRGLWRIRSCIDICTFAKFCAMEARREAAK